MAKGSTSCGTTQNCLPTNQVNSTTPIYHDTNGVILPKSVSGGAHIQIGDISTGSVSIPPATTTAPTTQVVTKRHHHDREAANGLQILTVAPAAPCLNVNGTINDKLFALGKVGGCTNVNNSVNNGEMTIGTVALVLI